MGRWAHDKREPVTREFLTKRADRQTNAGYTPAKWIGFCQTLLDLGLEVGLYEAQTTVSKYIYVSRPGRSRVLKIRFSDHRPNYQKEVNNNCDFFVGVSHQRVTTTNDALLFVTQRLHLDDEWV
jgi:hypothetical protein